MSTSMWNKSLTRQNLLFAVTLSYSPSVSPSLPLLQLFRLGRGRRLVSRFRIEYSPSIEIFHSSDAGVSIMVNMNRVKRTRLQHKKTDDDQKENAMESPSAHSCCYSSRGRIGVGSALIRQLCYHFRIVTSLAMFVSFTLPYEVSSNEWE